MRSGMMSGIEMFGSEFLGTAVMMAIACMVSASRSLPKSAAFRSD